MAAFGMSENAGEISRRHALRLVLGQGGEVALERDRIALELDQEAALEGAGRASSRELAQDAPEPAEDAPGPEMLSDR